jgi:CHAT domain-containing protein
MIQSGQRADTLSRVLGSRVLAPALNAMGPRVRRLIIVPDGPLYRLPFGALRLSDGRYATESYAISLSPSAGVLAALWRRDRAGRRSDRPMSLLAFGDPAFASDSVGPRLRTSAREARLAASYSPIAEVRLRKEASEAYLKRADLRRFRALHFATHTLVDDQTAARTSLVLAPGEGESGLVGPSELASLRLDADLVVLSSCRSAGGVVVRGEGVQGLTAPLLQAGARAVVATQWEVGDRSTVGFMEKLYRHLAEGRPVGDALQAAKLETIRRGAPEREWAAFVAVGDPLVEIPLRAPRGWPGWIVPLLAVVLAGGLVVAYSRVTRKRRMGEASSPAAVRARTHH